MTENNRTPFDRDRVNDDNGEIVVSAESPTLPGSINFAPFRFLALGLGLIVTLASIVYGALAVHHLFETYVGLQGIEPPLSALSTVGMLVALLLLTVTTRHQNTRAMCAILMLAWIVITLALVATDSVLRAEIVVAPDALVAIGKAVAALLPALALLACVLVVLAMNDHSTNRGAAASAAHYLGFGAKLAGIGASVMASAYFGIQHHIDPALAVFLGVVLESCFIWAYLSMVKSRERGDSFDVFMWSLATFLFGAFLSAVSVQTVSSLTAIDVPIVQALGDIGASLYVSAIGLALALTVITHLLTRAIDMPSRRPKAAGDQVIDAEGRPVARRIAGRIRGARSGWREIADAVRGDPALPAPSAAPQSRTAPTVTLADDAPNTGTPFVAPGYTVVHRTARKPTDEIPDFLAGSADPADTPEPRQTTRRNRANPK